MYHGIAEEYINQKSKYDSEENLVSGIIPTACETEIYEESIPRGLESVCYHGLGHAFMVLNSNDLRRSLNYCDFASKEEGFTTVCYTGVFMESLQTKQVGNNLSHPSELNYDQDNPDYPCYSLDEKYKGICFEYRGVLNVILKNDNIKEALEECLKVTKAYQERCFLGAGSNILGRMETGFEAGKKCDPAIEVSLLAYEQCVSGALRSLIHSVRGNPEPTVGFCGGVLEYMRVSCWKQFGRNMRGWVTSEQALQEKCGYFEESIAIELCGTPD
jgi:hypothetical protein